MLAKAQDSVEAENDNQDETVEDDDDDEASVEEEGEETVEKTQQEEGEEVDVVVGKCLFYVIFVCSLGWPSYWNRPRGGRGRGRGTNQAIQRCRDKHSFYDS
jgi:hypothetical protein